MERSGNFYKAIQLGYILISILIGCMAYNSLYEWQEIEALELGNKKIDELRKEINNINIQMIKFSLLGETILEWNDKDIEHYHARRMAMDFPFWFRKFFRFPLANIYIFLLKMLNQEELFSGLPYII